MKIAISNIAWDASENDTAAEIITSHGVGAIETAPTKAWEKPETATDARIDEYAGYWKDKGLQIVSSQSLLFGHPELEIFTTPESREQTFQYLAQIIHVCARMGATALVFGSPKNRLVRDMPASQAMDIAIDFFRRLGEVAEKEKACFCIEPNPADYACDFVRTAAEGVDLVKRVDHPGFRLHLDAAAMTLNNENYAKSIEASFPYLQHFHASEPYLGVLGEGKTQHAVIAPVLRSLGYDKWVSIEMKNGLRTPNTDAVKKALEVVTGIYA